MKIGDLIRYSESPSSRIGAHGLIIDIVFTGPDVEIEPPLVSILWETGEIEDVFEDELSLVQGKITVTAIL